MGEQTGIPETRSTADKISRFEPSQSFELMVEAVVDYAIFMLDAQGRVATWNRGAERIKGYRAEEIVGRHFSIFYPGAAIVEGLPEQELDLVAEEGHFSGEGWRIRRDGSRFWACVVITAVRDGSGNLIGFAKVTRDLTERYVADESARNAAQALERLNQQLNSVLECTSDGVMQVSSSWNLQYGNRRARAVLQGFELGRDFWASFPQVAEESEHRLRLAMAAKQATTLELYSPPAKAWFRVQCFPAEDGLNLFFSEITPEKALASQLELEQVLREKRIESLSIMAGGLAHEISNPLAIIHGTASDLNEFAAGEAAIPAAVVRESCATMVETADRAIRILRGLRGFAREGVQEPMRLTSLGQLIEQCRELQEDRCAAEQIELRTEVEEGLPECLCREIQIEQIVTNLLNNACDAVLEAQSDERWVLISVRFTGDYFEIDVTDSGPGVAEQFKAHLMEPFFTTKESGMGVGLSLSCAIAQHHGGSLALCSESERTRFRLTLPLAPHPRSEPAESRPAESAACN